MKHKLSLVLLTLVLFTGAVILFNFYRDRKSLSNNGLIDIGGGRKMFLECRGKGSPTVVFVSGRTDRADIWKTTEESKKAELTVFSEVSKFTHVCAYDRPGTVTIIDNSVEASRSTSVPQPVTPKSGVEDLHNLLTKAEVPGPFVLVGHSYGGLIVRLYTATYPNDVAGLVLVDTLTEFLYDALTPQQQKLWIRLNSNYSPDLDEYTTQERTDFIPSFEQLRNASEIGEIPVVILTSDEPYDFKSLIAKGILPADTPEDFGSVVFKAHLSGQKRMTNNLHGKQITNTHAGHYIQTEQPQLVIDSIREVVEKVRAKQ